MERIFYLLNQPPTGTDEAIAQADLRRAYLSLISAFFGNDMERIFISDGKKISMTWS